MTKSELEYEAGRRAALKLMARREKPVGTKEERLRAYAASGRIEAAQAPLDATAGRNRTIRSFPAIQRPYTHAEINASMSGATIEEVRTRGRASKQLISSTLRHVGGHIL